MQLGKTRITNLLPQQSQHAARAVDHLLLVARRTNEFHAMREPAAVPHHASHHEFRGMIRQRKFHLQAGSRVDLAPQEQAESANAHVASLSAEAGALAVHHSRDRHRNRDIMPFPAASWAALRDLGVLHAGLLLRSFHRNQFFADREQRQRKWRIWRALVITSVW